MKKFSFSLSMSLLVATVAMMFLACQKEQAPAADATTSSENSTIVGVSGSSISGLITNGNADALRSAYLKVAGSNETQYIKFKISDLVNYINAMKGKYNSDEIYVNFGVYNESTVPDDNKDYIGRKTVFFTVNNKKKSGGNIVVNGEGEDPQDPNSLNHGQIFP